MGGIGLDTLQHPFQHGDLISVIWIGMFSDLRHNHLRTWLLGVSWLVGDKLWFCWWSFMFRISLKVGKGEADQLGPLHYLFAPGMGSGKSHYSTSIC